MPAACPIGLPPLKVLSQTARSDTGIGHSQRTAQAALAWTAHCTSWPWPSTGRLNRAGKRPAGRAATRCRRASRGPARRRSVRYPGAGSLMYFAHTSGGPLMYPAGDLGRDGPASGGSGPPLSQRRSASGTGACCRLTSGPVWRLAVLAGLRERDNKMPPLGVRGPGAGLPVDVTLCKAIGRGLSGRADRSVGLGPD